MAVVAQSRYPHALALDEGRLTVRLLQRGDEAALLKFFKRLPVDERAMLKDDVTNPLVVAAWCSSIDTERVVPVVAIEGDRIVADATLHRNRSGWSRHVAQLRITVDPDHRRLGLGRALIKELCDLAVSLNVAILDAEIMSEQTSAIKVFERLGFEVIATLPQHVFDLVHQPHDLLILSKALIPVEQLSPDIWERKDADIGGSG